MKRRKLKWRKCRITHHLSDEPPYYFKAASPLGTFYVMSCGDNGKRKWGASLQAFNKNNDLDIGKCRVLESAAQAEAQHFLDKVIAKLTT